MPWEQTEAVGQILPEEALFILAAQFRVWVVRSQTPEGSSKEGPAEKSPAESGPEVANPTEIS